MRVYQKYDGANQISERDYDIAYNTDIKIGQVVGLTEGLVTACVQANTGKVLGIAMETHSGTVKELNTRSNGTKIRVCDCPDVVMACPATELTVNTGTTTTFVATTGCVNDNDAFNGGYIKDANGNMHRITDFAYNSTGTVATFTVATMASAPAADSKFKVFPPIGLAKGYFNSGITAVELSNKTMTSLEVIGRDELTDEVLYKAASHI